MTQTATSLPDGFGSAWVQAIFEAFLARAEDLGDLDRQSGDGDFGTNIASALRRARQRVEASSPQDYGSWLTAVSEGFLGTGGTSGPLFGMFFRELARATADPEPTLAELAAGLAKALATVQRYGKAKVGDKTMVDALAPAAEALSAAATAGESGPGALEAAAAAAVDGAKSTGALLARRGRSSYVGEVSRGILDPGAAAVAIILQAAATASHGGAAEVDTQWLTS